ncbi:MAG: hypothetical protein EB060_02840 [Proteobacteria bacterium]|nr:hypothetical protein [Pseudomonadota bacterium]
MTTITGTFSTRAEAESAISSLEARGITPSEIGLMMTDTTHKKMFNDSVNNDERTAASVKAAGSGAVIGSALGGILGGLTAVAAIGVPGLGLLAAGPVIAILTGAGAGAATGTFAGALIGAGIPDAEANEYEGALRSGKAIVTVHTNDEAKATTAKEILRPYNSFYRAA